MDRAPHTGELAQLQQVLISYRNLFCCPAPPHVIDAACARIGIEQFARPLPCFGAPGSGTANSPLSTSIALE
jgi:hypothetical protein